METMELPRATPSEVALSNEWKFDWRKCWNIVVKKICAWANGRMVLFGNASNYELEVSGEAGADGIGSVRFSKRFAVASRCYSYKVSDFATVKVCFENLNLPHFTLVVSACISIPVIGDQCFEVYRKDIVIGSVNEIHNLTEDKKAMVLPQNLTVFAFEVESNPELVGSCSCRCGGHKGVKGMGMTAISGMSDDEFAKELEKLMAGEGDFSALGGCPTWKKWACGVGVGAALAACAYGGTGGCATAVGILKKAGCCDCLPNGWIKDLCKGV